MNAHSSRRDSSVSWLCLLALLGYLLILPFSRRVQERTLLQRPFHPPPFLHISGGRELVSPALDLRDGWHLLVSRAGNVTVDNVHQ